MHNPLHSETSITNKRMYMNSQLFFTRATALVALMEATPLFPLQVYKNLFHAMMTSPGALVRPSFWEEIVGIADVKVGSKHHLLKAKL